MGQHLGLLISGIVSKMLYISQHILIVPLLLLAPNHILQKYVITVGLESMLSSRASWGDGNAYGAREMWLVQLGSFI